LKFLRDPKFLMWFNGVLAIVFAVLIIPALLLGWVNETAFVSVLSIWALTASHLAAWQSGHAERKEDKRADESP